MHLQVATSGEAVGGSRYRTLGRLGSGGMAEVDLAVQTGVAGSSRLCVLKRVRTDLAGRSEFVSMFFEEARISASLNHPNIVQIYEVGGDEQDCFLAMEFLRGRSYAHVQRLASSELIDYRIDLEVMLATLSGLEHAHLRRDLSGEPMRLVHRDISPPNLFVTYEGEIKVLDFGVAKSKDSLVITEAGILKGKVAYMAPEVVAGDDFDARADLYAVGVMLWEATAGRDRWPRMNDIAILAQIARGGPVESPQAAERGLPGLADPICIKALAEDPERRHQTSAEFRDDLLELCEQLGGRLSQLEIRNYMDRHFTDDRLREEREVDEALRKQRITPGSSRITEPEESGFTKRVKRGSERPAAGLAGTLLIGERAVAAKEPPSALEQTPLSQHLPHSPRSSGRVWVVLGGLSLAAVVLAKLLAPSREEPAPKATAAPVEKPASAPVEAPAPMVSVASTPAEAKPEASGSSAKSSYSTKLHAIKPGRAKASASASTPPASPATPATATAPRNLPLDRQDPWQE